MTFLLCLPVQSQAELADDISGNSLGARLSLLALHFPRLRMIWSRSLHATADIFRALKTHQDEPDPLTAAAIGGCLWVHLVPCQERCSSILCLSIHVSMARPRYYVALAVSSGLQML